MAQGLCLTVIDGCVLYVLSNGTGDDDAVQAWEGCQSRFPLHRWDNFKHGDIFIFAENATNEIAERFRKFVFRGMVDATRQRLGETH